MQRVEETAQAVTPAGLRLFQLGNPSAALGLAVSHLMTKPAFAQLRFGDWSRVLVGQINRKHYQFVIDEKNRVVGFLGWAVTDKETAETWVEGHGGFSDAQSREGNCIVFNAWSAETEEINRFLLAAARKVMRGKETVYFKRHYKNGGTRPVRIRVNDFVEGHIERREGPAGGRETAAAGGDLPNLSPADPG